MRKVPDGREVAAGRKIEHDLRCKCRIPLPQKRVILFMWHICQNREDVFILKKTRVIVLLGLFISMEVILSRFLSIQTPIVRISFAFIPAALSSIMFGPLLGGTAGALSDVIGMLIFPQGAYFPGFTLSAFISGAIYGLILYKKPKSILRTAAAVLFVTLFVNLGLNSVWVYMTTHKAVVAFIIPRIIKNLAIFPVQVILIYVMWDMLEKRFYKTNIF